MFAVEAPHNVRALLVESGAVFVAFITLAVVLLRFWPT
jgi:hypothetical protein